MVLVSKIPIRPLHQEVADMVRELILTGGLNTGDRIVETEMCYSLGISRTPFREALKIIASEGLIELVPNKGAFVARPSPQDVREMFEVMSILEGACARVWVERMTESAFKEIESIHQALETHYEARDHAQYLAVNRTFHAAVQEMAGNKVLNEVISGLMHKILLYRNRQLYQADRFRASIREHRDIMEAFRKKDAAGAESLMKLHLMNQGEAIVGLLKDRNAHKGDGGQGRSGQVPGGIPAVRLGVGRD